jgi:hypothetical protein
MNKETKNMNKETKNDNDLIFTTPLPNKETDILGMTNFNYTKDYMTNLPIKNDMHKIEETKSETEKDHLNEPETESQTNKEIVEEIESIKEKIGIEPANKLNQELYNEAERYTDSSISEEDLESSLQKLINECESQTNKDNKTLNNPPSEQNQTQQNYIEEIKITYKDIKNIKNVKELKTIVKHKLNDIIGKLPSTPEILMYLVFAWSYIVFKVTTMFTFLIMHLIIYTPYYFLPNMSNKTPIKLIKAIDEKGNEITKRLTIFMNMNWDKTMFDLDEDNETNIKTDKICNTTLSSIGGIDLDSFAEYIGSSKIWITYIMNCDIDTLYTNMINMIEFMDSTMNDLASEHSNSSIKNSEELFENNDRMSIDLLKKFVKVIMINTQDKVLYRVNKDSKSIDKEDIKFGDISF